MSAPTQANGQGVFFVPDELLLCACLSLCHRPDGFYGSSWEPQNREALAGLPPRRQLSLSCLGSPCQSIPGLELGPTGPLHLVTTAVAPVL